MHPETNVQPQIDLGRYYDEATYLSTLNGITRPYLPAVAQLIHLGVLGEEAEQAGWANIGEHCINSHHQARIHSYLQGFSQRRAHRLNTIALVHDATLRRDKETCGGTCTTHQGITRKDVGLDFYRNFEVDHPGKVLHVTGMNWNGYENWSLEEHALRYTDSTNGPTILPDGRLGNESFQHYRVRHKLLQKRKSDISQQIGEELYEGTPAFIYLDRAVVPYSEATLWNHARFIRPQYFENGKYSQPTDYFYLVANLLQQQATGRELPLM